MLILDPKYKVDNRSGQPGPVKADIDKMHAYRDAIVQRGGGRVVRRAAILYPGPTRIFAGGVAALQADPLRPEALGATLRHFLAAA